MPIFPPRCKEQKAGKIFVDMTGGTECEEMFRSSRRVSKHDVAMHSEEHRKAAEPPNVIADNFSDNHA
jgi:hypothetical protein